MASNRLFSMYHAGTPEYNKTVVVKSLCNHNGVVRVVFATITPGIGVNLASLNHVVIMEPLAI